MKEPEVLEKGDFVNVSLYRKLAFQEENSEEILISRESEESIIRYLKSNQNKITTKEAQIVLGLGERRSREILKDMIDKNILERVGMTTNTHYRLKNSIPQQSHGLPI